MAVKVAVKPAQVKKVTKVTEEKQPKIAETKRIDAVAPKKDVKTNKGPVAKKTTASEPKPSKVVRVDISKPVKIVVPKKETSSEKTAYHVSKRDNDGREWKVFIQGSTKVIKLFATQAEALAYAKDLCRKKDDGSYVMLHGLDGKIRKC